MEGNSNTQFIKHASSNLKFSDPQEGKQEAVPPDADPIHSKEELVVWTKKLLKCYMISIRLNLYEIC